MSVIEELEALIEECDNYILDGPEDTERVKKIAIAAHELIAELLDYD